MKVIVVYRDQSDHARPVIDWLRDFARVSGKYIEALDPDSQEGISFCGTYDIVEYPSLVALDDNGIMQNMWRGLPMPSINEVSYYAPENIQQESE